MNWTTIAAIASACGTVAAAVIAAISIRFNRRVVEEMVQERTGRLHPRILPSFHRHDGKIWITVRNIGGAAANVRFTFEPNLINSQGRHIGQSPPFSETWPIIYPGDTRDVFFDIAFYLGEVVTEYSVMISAHDIATGTPRQLETVRMDLKPLAPYGPLSGQIYQAKLADKGPWVIPRWNLDPERMPSPYELSELHDTSDKLVQQIPALRGLAGYGPERHDVQYSLQEVTQELTRRDWAILNDGCRVAAIKKQGPHQGDIVLARGWSYGVALAFALERVQGLEASWE